MKKVIVFSREQLMADLRNGRIMLKDVPKRIRMRGLSFYVAALRYYRYVKTIDSPFEVMYNDINSLPDGYEKQRFIDNYNDYALPEGHSYESRNKKRVKACSRENLLSDLLDGKIQLKDIPQNIRTRSSVYYSYAIRHYEYCKDTDNPFEIMRNDINSITDEILKQNLISTYNIYGKSKGLVYGKDDAKEKTDTK